MVPEKVPLYKKPEQVLNVTLLIVATGNTLTVTVKPSELHPLGAFGVTKYVAVPTVFPVFVNVPLKLLAFVPPTPGFTVPAIDGALQL
jgi:hypothetical protein